MWPQWSNTLSAGQWAILAAIPPALVALYFLKLRRRSLQVPSTYLWKKSFEDLHVNSFWQRLRKNLLLLLQLLIVALVMLSLLRPSWRDTRLLGQRSILLIDNSASMGASDVQPSRLEAAKRRAGELIDQMESADVAMIISFADGAEVAQSFTNNRQELRRGLDAIQQTDRPTSLAEVLRVASGLANPGRSANDIRDFQVAEALPARLFILSDGKFSAVNDFSLGNLDPVYVPIGTPGAANLGIVTFATQPKDEHPGERQVYAQVQNFGPQPAATDVSLYLDGELIDAEQVALAAGESHGVTFDLRDVESGVLELRLDAQDTLAIDDRAWTALNAPQKVRVLLVTSGDEPLEMALRTAHAKRLAAVERVSPEYLRGTAYRQRAADGAWKLIIFDRCAPDDLPQANTFFIGALPPGKSWGAKAAVAAPQIIDTDAGHPLMRLLNLGDVLIAEGRPLLPPAGAQALVDTSAGPILAIAAREGFEDAVLGCEIVGANGIGTNWPLRLSFPVFVLNLLEYFGGGQTALATGNLRPGNSVTLHLDERAESIMVSDPDGKQTEVSRGKAGEFRFAGAAKVGVYAVHSGGEVVGRFATNLFDAGESDVGLRANPEIRIGHANVSGQPVWEGNRREIWKLLVLLALAIVVFEWYIYNRRVYL
jgi:hypothetical protein